MPDFIVLKQSDNGVKAQVTVMPYANGLGGPVADYTLLEPLPPDVTLPCLADGTDDGEYVTLGSFVPLRPGRVKKVDSQGIIWSTGTREERLPHASTGLNEIRDVQPLEQHKDVLAAAPDGVLVWVRPGGAHGWIAERARKAEEQARKAEEQARKAEERARKAEEEAANQRAREQQQQAKEFDPLAFVNPYTFVPLPDRVERSAPRGHASMTSTDGSEGLSGWFDVLWTLKSPYLLPQDSTHVDGERLTVPGSTVKGIVRSTHEVLCSGCMRVLKLDYVPVHREVASTQRSGGWTPDQDRLAVVSEAQDGRPKKVQLCGPVTWVRLAKADPGESRAQLLQDLPTDARQPRVAYVGPPGQPGQNKRLEMQQPGVLKKGDTHVVHLTDARARRPPPSRTEPLAYYAAVAELPAAGTPKLDVDDKAYCAFQELCEGTDDLRRRLQKERTGNSFDQYPSVSWGKVNLGHRRAADGTLHVGDTVWVRDNGNGHAQNLRMAVLWRTLGKGKVADRLAESGTEPCTTPDSLCRTCQLFGSAESERTEQTQRCSESTKPQRTKLEQQLSYAAHVRFGPLTSADGVTCDVIPALAPLAAPKPSAGMFYLQAYENMPRNDPQQPASRWGSEADDAKCRPLAGRKFYWHGMDPAGKRHVQRGHADTVVRKNVRCVPAGTVLQGRVWFDNLDAAQLGSLLAAVSPQHLLHDVDSGEIDVETGKPRLSGRTFALHLGGGKPLGFGSVTTEVDETSLVVMTAQQRYGRGDPAQLSIDKYVEAARQTLTEPKGRVPEAWRALAAALTLDRVGGEQIWYPIGGRRPTSPDGDFKEADESYKFFAKFGGGPGKKKPKMKSLPPATAIDQRLRWDE